MWAWEEKEAAIYINWQDDLVNHLLCVHKKWGLTHRPQPWLRTSGPSGVGSKTVRNRGATPKCHHSCKTAEHKSHITEICTTRPPVPENTASLKGDCPPVLWKESCIMSAISKPGWLKELQLDLEPCQSTAWSLLLLISYRTVTMWKMWHLN